MKPMKHQDMPMELNDLSRKIIGFAVNVHTHLGPGLLESAYKECLFHEIKKAGYKVEKEKALPLIYESIKMDIGCRVDLLVDNRLIIEIKAAEALTDVHSAQVITYLKLSGCRVGLLVNFNVALLKDGIKRLVL